MKTEEQDKIKNTLKQITFFPLFGAKEKSLQHEDLVCVESSVQETLIVVIQYEKKPIVKRP